MTPDAFAGAFPTLAQAGPLYAIIAILLGFLGVMWWDSRNSVDRETHEKVVDKLVAAVTNLDKSVGILLDRRQP